MLVLYVSWSSSGYAQLHSGCKHRRPSTSNSVEDDRNLVLPETLSPLSRRRKGDFSISFDSPIWVVPFSFSHIQII